MSNLEAFISGQRVRAANQLQSSAASLFPRRLFKHNLASLSVVQRNDNRLAGNLLKDIAELSQTNTHLAQFRLSLNGHAKQEWRLHAQPPFPCQA